MANDDATTADLCGPFLNDEPIEMTDTFRVGYTADFYDSDGEPRFADYGRTEFDQDPQIAVSRLADHELELAADQVAGLQGIVVLSPCVTRQTVADCPDLLVVARFGVGYDSVDVTACSEADVLVTITRGAVDRSVAEATIGWMISLAHHVRAKDRLVRDGKWEGRAQFMGTELRERTLGVVGCGGIGRAIVGLLSGFGMQTPLVFDPFLNDSDAANLGVCKVELDELLAQADFVSINCPLTDGTRNLIASRELDLMKPSAYLINTARGGIVHEDALFDALTHGSIAGAALDCFVDEPFDGPHRFGTLDNVLLAPHCIAWTHELFRDIGRTACQIMIDLAHGETPIGVVNPELLNRRSFREKWKRLQLGS